MVPPPSCERNNRSAQKEPDFVEKTIEELFKIGVIIELKEQPTVVNPLTVSNNGTKLRMVLDLRNVNKFVLLNKIKFEDIRVASLFFKKGAWIITFDLKSGYHHLDINQAHQQFLGFVWETKKV